MITSTDFALPKTTVHAAFLAILPRIERHGRVFFRHVKSAVQKEDAIAEMVARSWIWFLRLRERGQDPSRFPSAIASFSARAVGSGRRLCGQEKSKDVLSRLAQHRHGFTVSPLPEGSRLNGNVYDDALIDNTVTPVDEQVAFRMDFPQWLSTYSDRDRRIALNLMAGDRTQEASDQFGLSPARISQMRQQFRDHWRRFQHNPSEERDGDRTAVA